MLLSNFKITAFFLLLLLCSTADSWWDRRRRRRRTPPPDTTPPSFKNCRSHWTVTTTSPSTTVTWTEPTGYERGYVTAYDSYCDDFDFPCTIISDIDAPTSRSGPPPGSTFREGRHSIVYTTTDNVGNSARCTISFTVERVRCSSISSASHRSYSCSNSRYAYSTCYFRCSTGYYVSGSSSVTCYSSGYWSGSFPSCQVMRCSPPATPTHGSAVNCHSLRYGETCYFQCNSGYSLVGSSSRTCQGSSWSGSTPICRDTQPPRFSACSSNIHFSNDDRTTSAVVIYPIPRASDNSGSTPSMTKVAGRDSGTRFSSGTHAVRYRATDGSGNYADCAFSITVSVISCPSIPLQDTGIVHCSNGYLKGTTCTLECAVGYVISGPSQISCRSDGTWSNDFQSCTEITCSELSAPSNGNVMSCSRSFGSLCEFSCGEGYGLIGSASRFCDHIAREPNGYWTGTQPRCEINTCPYSTGNERLRGVTRPTCQVSSENTVIYGSVCEYTCDTGHQMNGNHLRTCGPNGDWTEPLPTCHVITCDLNSLPTPTNGERTGCTGSSVSFGNSCFLSCNRGYRPTATIRRTCEDNGSGQGAWSGETITCSLVTCNPLSPPRNGRITDCRREGSSVAVTSLQPFDTSCSVNCNAGYTLTSGSSSLTCLTSGQWDREEIVCTDETPPIVQCPSDLTVYAEPHENVGVPNWDWEPLSVSDVSGSYTATLSYVNGEPVSSRPQFFVEGSHILLYRAVDSSGNFATCSFEILVKVVRCPPLHAPIHGRTSGWGCSSTSSSILGTVCQLECDEGYEASDGDSVTTCTQAISNPSKGYWFGSQLSECSGVRCLLPTLAHGSINGCNDGFSFYEESCQFVCDLGYRTPAGESSRTRTCQADRTWTGHDFHCSVQVQCLPLQVPSHGTVQPTSCSSMINPYGTACHFVCDEGYDLSGPSMVECFDSGTWSDTTPATCSDAQAPVFKVSCPYNVEEIADEGQTNWAGQVEPPAATDNSGQATVQSLGGSPPSTESTYPEGRTSMLFEAVDPSGNEAFCTVNLHVLVKRCNNLQHPYGGLVHDCTNHYGSICRISCTTGYELSSGSTERTCELDRNQEPYWTGSDTVCTVRRCPVVVPPENALPSHCGGTPGNLATFGSVCSFYCPHGFNPRGNDRVECQADGSWSDTNFVCEVTTCPSLSQPGVFITPAKCQNAPQYRQQCVFSCPTGLSVSPISSVQVTCLGNGKWSGETRDIVCIDATPPYFEFCPTTEDLIFYTDPSTGNATVNWSVSATDSSSVEPTITCDPERGSLLMAERYHVICVARDEADNEGRCIFDIKVKDRTCPPLTPPHNGMFVGYCSYKEGSRCTVRCNDGYRITGSSDAKCQTINGETHWVKDSSPRCEAVTCNALVPFDNRGRIHPFFCLRPSNPHYRAVCDIGCTDRYTLVTNPREVPSSVECGQNGSWNYDLSETYACSDEVVPDVSYCPPPVRVTRTDVSQPVTVNFDLPLASDNSGEDIQLVLTPSVTPPLNVNESTTIHCLFEDSSGNQNDQCQIEIVVIDDVPPVLTRPCPANQEITARTKQTEVFWTEPLFEDPGGKHVIVFTNYESGSKFAVGSYAVKYTAINEITGREAECQFNVDVRLESCPPLETPANGALACHDTNEGQVCVLSCLPGFRSAPRQPTTFFCDAMGKWQPSRVVDCGVKNRPSRSRVPVQASYSANDCSSAGQAPSIASAFLDQLLMTQFADLCSGLIGCSVDDIKVTCGPVNRRRSRGRGKRLVEGFENLVWTFEFDIGVDVEADEALSDNDAIEHANTTLQSLAQNVGNFIPETVNFPETFGDSTTFLPDSVEVNEVLLICDAGFTSNELNSECVACVAGSFFSEDTKDCQPCPVGSYQDEDRQTVCKVCPDGTSTEGDRAKRLDECYGLCPSGTYSTDGLFGCKKCDIGFYQPAMGQTSCLSCPEGLLTVSLGTRRNTECTRPCPSGTSSPSGLEPCVPCPLRYFQPAPGQRFCLICDGRKTTERVGSINQSQCIDLNNCLSEPCQNRGSCLSILEGYVCSCPVGFSGQNCEVNDDDCKEQSCKHGGTCVDGISSFQCLCGAGFEGPDCSINVNECASHPCTNGGTCEDGLDTFLCHCPSIFDGPLCESEKDPCESYPCFNNGTCEKYGWDYDCLCPLGFKGKNCNTSASFCEGRPCRHGACVEAKDRNYQCLCYIGFTGENCETEIDFCAGLICSNGGTCVQNMEGATCICPQQFAGYYDETCSLLDTCMVTPCENGGTCHQYDYLVSECECQPGYSGSHCEVDINECASFPCMNFASCEDKLNGYHCICQVGFIGTNCEINEFLEESDGVYGSGSDRQIFQDDLTEDGSGSGFGIFDWDQRKQGSGSGLDIFYWDQADQGSGSGREITNRYYHEEGSGSNFDLFYSYITQEGSGSGRTIPDEDGSGGAGNEGLEEYNTDYEIDADIYFLKLDKHL